MKRYCEMCDKGMDSTLTDCPDCGAPLLKVTAPKIGRFVIEGEWSGYQSSQQRIVHVSVHRPFEKTLRKWATETHAIYYTDGTALYLTVRDAKPNERITERRSYMSLIEDCARHNVNTVSALCDIRKPKATTGATA